MEDRAIALRERMELGDVFYKSQMFTDLKSAAQAVVKIQAGAELGIPPFAAMTGIFVIQGKVALGAGLIAGRIKASGKYNYKVTRMDDTGCTVEFYEGSTKLGVSSFTTDDAKRAGLLGNPTWGKYPRNMCFSRAISNGARWYCPDIFSGSVYTPEELGGDMMDADYSVVAEQSPAPKAEPDPSKGVVMAADNPADEEDDERQPEPERAYWYAGRTKAIHKWLNDTYGVNIDTIHDMGHKLRDFNGRDAFVAWCKANLEPKLFDPLAVAAERAEAEQLAASVGGEVAA